MDNKLPVGAKMVRECNGGIKLGGLILGLRVTGNLRGKNSWFYFILFIYFQVKNSARSSNPISDYIGAKERQEAKGGPVQFSEACGNFWG